MKINVILKGDAIWSSLNKKVSLSVSFLKNEFHITSAKLYIESSTELNLSIEITNY